MWPQNLPDVLPEKEERLRQKFSRRLQPLIRSHFLIVMKMERLTDL